MDPSGKATDHQLRAALRDVGMLQLNSHALDDSASSGTNSSRAHAVPEDSQKRVDLDDLIRDGGRDWSLG